MAWLIYQGNKDKNEYKRRKAKEQERAQALSWGPRTQERTAAGIAGAMIGPGQKSQPQYDA
jgi:hypothetical protein